MPSCSAAGDWDLAAFALPGSCGLCQRDESRNQVSNQLDEKHSLACLARNHATEHLFEFLGDEEPLFTSSHDECIDKSGRTVARIFINGTEVQSGRVSEEVAKRIVAQAEDLIDQWNDAKERWIVARNSADPNWYPPDQLNYVCGIQTAYSDWFKKCVNADRVNKEAYDIYTQWDEENSRLEGYKKAREDLGDVKDSIRGHLPFMEKPQRTTKAFSRRPSPLRNEVKVEDIADEDDDGEMVDLEDSDDDDVDEEDDEEDEDDSEGEEEDHEEEEKEEEEEEEERGEDKKEHGNKSDDKNNSKDYAN